VPVSSLPVRGICWLWLPLWLSVAGAIGCGSDEIANEQDKNDDPDRLFDPSRIIEVSIRLAPAD
jgi:hypothetical protein